MHSIVLMRHGETEWSRQNRFAGWSDVGLSRQGVQEAKRAGDALAASGWDFDRCHTSVLRRAIHTLDIVAQRMDLAAVPVSKSWRLNERHYGSLQGRHRAAAIDEFGPNLVYSWRREFHARPPALPDDDPRLPEHDPTYADLLPEQLPRSESHSDTVVRVEPYWREVLAPQIRSGERALVVSHTSSIRGLVKLIEGLSDEEIHGFKIATAVPLVYELDQELRPVDKRYLPTGLAGRARVFVSRIKPRRSSRWLG